VSRIEYHALRVLEVIEETPDARSILLDAPPELRERFRYKPGQFLTLRLPCSERMLPRCYSLSSTPLLDEPLRITVKRVAGGRGSNWLCGCLRAGDSVSVAAPAGLFTPRDLDGDLLLFAGGSGITPVLSIIRSVLTAGKGRLRLLYANRDEQSVIFAAELARLSREFPTRLQVVHWLDSVQGIPSQAQIAALAHGWLAEYPAAECFICGPSVFMDATAAALRDLGVASHGIHIERFVSLPEEGDDGEAAALQAQNDGVAATVAVTLDQTSTTVPVKAGQLLIDAFEEAGLQPPYSCRSGACAACMCKLEDGEVELLSNFALDQHDLDQGWILACQAIARSPTLRISYPT
jgi:3-ketosteroid 9alpha-monooxygenase subunit B